MTAAAAIKRWFKFNVLNLYVSCKTKWSAVYIALCLIHTLTHTLISLIHSQLSGQPGNFVNFCHMDVMRMFILFKVLKNFNWQLFIHILIYIHRHICVCVCLFAFNAKRKFAENCQITKIIANIGDHQYRYAGIKRQAIKNSQNKNKSEEVE